MNMKNILESDLREKAGSDSYNRFEYQAHWIVYHMIQEYKNNKEYIIFCEFHDDMAKSNIDGDNTEFFQIKTSAKYKEWSFPRLFNRVKKNNGNYKHSFLGFIFYNFLHFEDECHRCHFVSNIGMDKEVAHWQSKIEDGLLLKDEDPTLYTKIYDLLKKEYIDIDKTNFEEKFEKFVQNTFLYNGDLSLDNYEKVVSGEFFQALDNEDIYTSNSNKILRDIIDDVRKKSKTIITTPISYTSLVKQKGISSNVFTQLKQVMSNTDQDLYDKLEIALAKNLTPVKYKLIIRLLKKHHQKLLDINDLLYQENTSVVDSIIDKVLIEHYSENEDIKSLLNYALEEFNKLKMTIHPDFNNVLVEAIFYEKTI